MNATEQNLFANAKRTYANACDTAIEMSLSGRCYAVYQSSNGTVRYTWKHYKPEMGEWNTPEGHSQFATVKLVALYRAGNKIS